MVTNIMMNHDTEKSSGVHVYDGGTLNVNGTVISNCDFGINSAGNSASENNTAHPYVEELKILCAKNTDSSTDGTWAVEHLNKIFGRASGTVFGSIKESFIGTEHERQGYKAGADALKPL